MERKIITTGTKWERLVGYSRAVRVGSIVEIAGTTAMDGDEIQFPGDVYGQAVFIIHKMQRALQQLGGSLENVVRTRVYLTDISHWEAAGKAHGEFFNHIQPASTMLSVQALIHPDLLVEIEMSAIIPENHVQD